MIVYIYVYIYIYIYIERERERERPIGKKRKSRIFGIFDVLLYFFIFLRPFWGPGGIPLDSQRNFDPPQDLNTPGSFFWTHFSNFLTFVLGFYKKSGFHFSEPDLLIRKEIKYPDPCHPLRKTLLCRKLRISAWFMTPTIHFFIFFYATLTIRAK